MGMSTHIIGFRPADEKWKKMKAIYDSCRAAGVDVPKAVYEFFDYSWPDEAGVKVDLDPGPENASVIAYRNDSEDGFEIDLERIRADHPNVTKIRVWNSW